MAGREGKEGEGRKGVLGRHSFIDLSLIYRFVTHLSICHSFIEWVRVGVIGSRFNSVIGSRFNSVMIYNTKKRLPPFFIFYFLFYIFVFFILFYIYLYFLFYIYFYSISNYYMSIYVFSLVVECLRSTRYLNLNISFYY